jgi:urate oxidase
MISPFKEVALSSEFDFLISYGKMRVPVYRVYATPLIDIQPIPESQFTGRSNTLLAMEADVEVFGRNFLPAYTQGDNSMVVATDSMKNFVLREAFAYEGATLEGYVEQLGSHLLTTYAIMESLRLTVRELPFQTISVPQGSGFANSEVLFSRSHNDFATVTLDFTRENGQPVITSHRCGQLDLELFKVTGSSFTSFVRDEYTTLPERKDRPLFIYLNVYWKYSDLKDMLSADHVRYVPAEQVRDLIQTVFHEFVSESIQHLVYEMGRRLLLRFPQLAEVSFEGQNRTRDPMVSSDDDEKRKVYSDPFPAYGLIKLTLSRK